MAGHYAAQSTSAIGGSVGSVSCRPWARRSRMRRSFNVSRI